MTHVGNLGVSSSDAAQYARKPTTAAMPQPKPPTNAARAITKIVIGQSLSGGAPEGCGTPTPRRLSVPESRGRNSFSALPSLRGKSPSVVLLSSLGRGGTALAYSSGAAISYNPVASSPRRPAEVRRICRSVEPVNDPGLTAQQARPADRRRLAALSSNLAHLSSLGIARATGPFRNMAFAANASAGGASFSL